MTRAKDLKQDGSSQDNDTDTTPAEERARVRQARESVQDAIGKIIGEPIGEQPDGDADVPEADNPDADVGSGDRDDARKPVSPPVKRGHRSDENGAD